MIVLAFFGGVLVGAIFAIVVAAILAYDEVPRKDPRILKQTFRPESGD